MATNPVVEIIDILFNGRPVSKDVADHISIKLTAKQTKLLNQGFVLTFRTPNQRITVEIK